ncbi:MAG: aminotransferase class I/II-fold pyridoxal phosphate-dependent enzyme [Bacteroidota bacterium]
MTDLSKRLDGVGTYYFANKLAQIRGMNAEGERVINLGIGSPDMPPPAEVREKLISVLSDPDVNQYQSYRSLPELRQAFAKWYQTHFNTSLDPEKELLPLIGSKEGIMHISMTFLSEGDEVLVPNPGYPAYAACCKLAGGKVREYALNAKNGWMPDLEQLAKEDLPAVKLMWVNYPHMPTGTRATKELFERLITFGREHQILICHDNPYAFILNEEPLSILESEGAKEHCLELSSLSKCYNMAGWRVGCLAGSEANINAVLKFKSNMDSGMFKGIQEAAIAALANGQEWFEQLNAQYKHRRKLAWQIMDFLGCDYDKDGAGLFVWGKIPKYLAEAENYSEEILQKSRVFITPGMVFGSQGNSYLRISLCSPMNEFELAFERISDAFNKENK